MGLFDKLSNVIDKTTQVVESKVSKVVDTTTIKSKELLSSEGRQKISENIKENSYIPKFVNLAESIPTKCEDVSNSLVAKVEGTERVFYLEDKELVISASKDSFNSYRLMFRELAIKCAEKAESEYQAKVNNYVAFVEEFPRIYDNNLYPMIQLALNILLSNNIWDIDIDSFTLTHKSNFRLIIDDYETMQESTRLTIANNKKMTDGVVSLATNFISSKTGMLGGSSLFENISEGGKQASIEGTGIAVKQQEELYQRIDTDMFFSRIFSDYLNVCLTLICIMKDFGHDIWVPDSQRDSEASRIFSNLSNPNFPQDKIVDAMITILDANPYNVNYYKFMVSRFGETEQVTALREYFGYTDFDNSKMC